MARFVVGDDRSQSTLFPERLEDYANPRATDFNDLKDATWAWSHRMRGYRHHHSQRKPLAKSHSEKRPPLNVETARNSLSQWPPPAITVTNRRKRRHN
jgi:hypothetical protein